MMAPQQQVMVADLATIIGGTNGLYIEEWPTLIPACGGCKMIGTKYIAYGSGATFENKGAPIFTATERADCCEKTCCQGAHGFTMEVRPGNFPDGWIWGMEDPRPILNTIERRGCCSGKQCLWCPAFATPCLNELSVYGPEVPMGVKAGEIKAEPLFTSTQANGCKAPFCPVIEARAGNEPPAMSMKGPCAFGGCLGLCVATEFKATDTTGEVGSFRRTAPEGCIQMCCRCATKYDQFRVDFAETATPDQKMVIATGAFLADVMIFDKDKGICKCESDGSLRINLCNLYCCGAICPVFIWLKGK